ncbi:MULTISPECIES: NifU family protein [Methanothrix]|jgi:Fe-S cluster biogenesis protein NfuA|uniref:NifU-like domain protein n=3 Tax=root TaxID=1 RepID=F4BUV2_METSG|nr:MULTISPECIES: NifU family protein [Methanothrix]MDD2328514.1 NifU family protein [bacterium]NYT10083.1 NifU family protein [Methanosarcinales archaeon]OPX82302.1 MAG: Fe/S biogenesis protein NfuA [Methanosaeta sp. PtaB.Bin005]AEB68342.1 NifU-like domain protein [Methanothrix soehngenii GP6]MBP7067518.1 NifU family protein [Methanothrix sp.]
MQNLNDEVEAALGKIREGLRVDGGDVELVDISDGIVTVRLQGHCAGCPFSQMTLKNFIEKELVKSVAGIKGVVSV